MELHGLDPEAIAAERKILHLLGLNSGRYIIDKVNASVYRPGGSVTLIDRHTAREHTVTLDEDDWPAIVDIVNTHLQAIADRKPHA